MAELIREEPYEIEICEGCESAVRRFGPERRCPQKCKIGWRTVLVWSGPQIAHVIATAEERPPEWQ